MITIYNFARGIRGTRVAWMCEEMGLPYRVETVPYPAPQDYRARHPLGSVPFLEDDSGVAIGESVAMILYLAHRYGPTPLLPDKNDPRLGRVMHMTVFGEASLGAPINTLLAAHFGAPDDDKRNWSVRGLEQHVESAIDYVATLLGAQTFLAGDEPTLADVSIATSLGLWKGALGKDLPDALLQYRERIGERAAYRRALAATRPAT
jgi:glutathione S-transferase